MRIKLIKSKVNTGGTQLNHNETTAEDEPETE
jgi:hypothetical protein